MLLRTRAADRLKAALKLRAAQSSRACCCRRCRRCGTRSPGLAESQRGFAELQSAAQLFEQSSGTSDDAPGWGHAEAYLALGHELQIRGDHLGARNWIEKALIAAPDYKMAQRQLALLAKP